MKSGQRYGTHPSQASGTHQYGNECSDDVGWDSVQLLFDDALFRVNGSDNGLKTQRIRQYSNLVPWRPVKLTGVKKPMPERRALSVSLSRRLDNFASTYLARKCC